MNSIFSFIEHYRLLLESFPLVIQIAIIVIFANILITISFFAVTFFLRRTREQEDKVMDKYRPKIEQFFKEVLESQDIYSENEIDRLYFEKIGKLGKKSYLTIIPVLEDMAQHTPEILEAKNYYVLIRGLRVDEHVERKISFSNTTQRLRAFQTLSRLNLTVSDSKILPYTYSKNNKLRKESRTSYIGVSKNDPFKFFDKGNADLNYWDQIALLKQFEAHHGHNLPSFSKWIKYSEDQSQIIFLVRAVAYFNQVQSADVVIDLLKSDNHKIRKEAILALGKMRIKDSESELKKIYHTQPIECQDAIMEAIAYISSGESLDFLKEAFYKATDPESKKLIAEVIYTYGEKGKACFEVMEHSVDKKDSFEYLIFEHVRNPLIPTKLEATLVNQKINDISPASLVTA